MRDLFLKKKEKYKNLGSDIFLVLLMMYNLLNEDNSR